MDTGSTTGGPSSSTTGASTPPEPTTGVADSGGTTDDGHASSSSSSPPSSSGSSSSTGSDTEAEISCDNQILDGNETDIDCGGNTCDRCDEGSACTQDIDCQSALCNGSDSLCAGPPTLLWLDGGDPSQMFTDNACTIAVAADDDPVRCWRSRGQLAAEFVSSRGEGRYEIDGGVQLDDDLLVASGVFGANVAEVAVFVVATEVAGTNSFDFNLNHPNTNNIGRYSCHLPWNTSRRIVWDAGNTEAARVRTTPDLVDVGQTHIFGFVNSAAQGTREIWLDGSSAASGPGHSDAPASNVSLGDRANLHVFDFRVVQPAPNDAQREIIEGDLACRWDLRSLLDPAHPYYAADDTDDTGCP
ncbi:MAG: hypothetical protein K0V04_40685 [Deltaproteobacteria bacterium]|nr:hypothetical protein [Deltaproteobacteria bacterium]